MQTAIKIFIYTILIYVFLSFFLAAYGEDDNATTAIVGGVQSVAESETGEKEEPDCAWPLTLPDF
mgnify:FL=1